MAQYQRLLIIYWFTRLEIGKISDQVLQFPFTPSLVGFHVNDFPHIGPSGSEDTCSKNIISAFSEVGITFIVESSP